MMELIDIQKLTGFSIDFISSAFAENEFTLDLESIGLWYKEKIEGKYKNNLTNLIKCTNIEYTTDQKALSEQIKKWSERLVVTKRG